MERIVYLIERPTLQELESSVFTKVSFMVDMTLCDGTKAKYHSFIDGPDANVQNITDAALKHFSPYGVMSIDSVEISKPKM